eukprot:TRINITY_DN7876_c0_g1_i2.p1 TRINITY_DN7876_c0_g1~~TRINITY_DN7876_c0_g1_i2.p1  ORF type:complete len:486 (-),score=105.81 TRINITY_DN7876_c0_g1_i2:226-1683(-)
MQDTNIDSPSVTGWIETGCVRAKKRTDRSRRYAFAVHFVADCVITTNLNQNCYQEEETPRKKPLAERDPSLANDLLIVLGSKDQHGAVKIFATEKYVTSPLGSLSIGLKPEQLPVYLWIGKEEICKYHGKNKADDGIQLFIRVVLNVNGIELMADVPFQTRSRNPGPIGARVPFSIISIPPKQSDPSPPSPEGQELQIVKKQRTASPPSVMRTEEQILHPTDLFDSDTLLSDQLKVAIDLSYRFPQEGLIIDSAIMEDVDSFPLVSDMVLLVMQHLRPHLFRTITSTIAFLNMKLRYQAKTEGWDHAIHWEDRCLIQSIFGEDDVNIMCHRMPKGPFGTHLRIQSLDDEASSIVVRDLFYNSKLHTSLMARWNESVRPGTSLFIESYRLTIPMVTYLIYIKPILDSGVDLDDVMDTSTFSGNRIKEIRQEDILREFIENSREFPVVEHPWHQPTNQPRMDILDGLIQRRAALNISQVNFQVESPS